MQRKPNLIAVFFLIGLLLFQGIAPALQAQTAPPVPPPTPQELDQLLAPIALYPDSLLAQITTAATNPQEILDVNQWLEQNQNLTGAELTDAAQQQGFDPAFIALVNFPQVLEMMAEHIDDYAAIGAAFSADQGEVSASIQRLRAQAYASGALRSTPQQQVEVQQSYGQPIYIIQPANPQVVYVPQYDPTVVYVRPSEGALLTTSLLSFGIGFGIGALLVSNHPWGWGGWGWNWGGRSVYYNHGSWGGWHNGYRPPRPWYRPQPVPYGGRPGYHGNWGYRPPNYRPPSYNRAGYTQPGYNRPGNPNNRPGYNQPGYNPGNRPGTGNLPPAQPNRPGYNPGNTRPGNQPGYENRPPAQPNRPAYNPGNNRPGNQPAYENRPPAQPNKPAYNPGNNRPGNQPAYENRPPAQPNKPAYNPGNNRPGNQPAYENRPPAQPNKPAYNPGNNRPGNQPAYENRPPAQQNRPAPTPPSSPGAGHPQPNRPTTNRPAPEPTGAQQRPSPQSRPSGGGEKGNKGPEEHGH